MQPAPLSAEVDAAQLAAQLLQRASVLRDEQQIENLQRIYGYYIDRNMWDAAAELFAVGGSIELAQQGIYRGKERIAAFLRSQGPEGLREGWLNDHVQLQTLVTVAADGMTARARTREWNMTGQYQAEGSGRWSEGVYENRYVKVNGEWRIAALHYYPTFITDYDEGWTRSALPAPGIDPALPPDAPPSLVFDMFPAVYAIPFHYRD